MTLYALTMTGSGVIPPTSTPNVQVKRRTRTGDIVIDCPHCGLEHHHGREYGCRVAHCDPPRPDTWVQGYRIVPPPNG